MSKPSAAATRLNSRQRVRRASRPGQFETRVSKPVVLPSSTKPDLGNSGIRLTAGALLLAAGLWSYWPTLTKLYETWARVEDYSHGFLIVPLAIGFLWVRRRRFPGLSSSAPWSALALLAISLTLRHASDYFYFTFLDGWSIVPWTAACVALIGGWPLLLWSWTAILFLAFMVPLPFSVETVLSGPLQQIATVISTAVLQFLGQPAFADGNVILLGENRLEVAQACSGLRLFVFIAAITYAYVALIDRPWWEKLLLIAAAAPIAVGANALRIVATGLLFQWFPGATAHEWSHSTAGWGMVLIAAAAFWMLLVYLRLLIKEELVMDMAAMVKHSRT